MKSLEEKRYEKLSPFELKDKLIKIAKSHHEKIRIGWQLHLVLAFSN
jgi:hypothetical protein